MIDDVYPKQNNTLMARLLTVFFRLLYHPFAWTYDMVAAAVSFGQWRRWVFAAADLLEGPRVLELGYGPGHLQVQLVRQGFQVYGLDESMQMARQATRRLRRDTGGVKLSRGLAQALPYPSNTFDNVVATFPTQYIVNPNTLAEIYRVLKPGGRLVVLFSAWVTGKSVPERALALLYQVTGQSPGAVPEPGSAPPPFKQVETRLVESRGGRLLFFIAQKEPDL